MALARLALRNWHQRVSTSSLGSVQRQRLGNEFLKRFMATSTSDKKKEGKEVAVTEKKSRLFPWRKGKRSLGRSPNIPIPALYGLGNALLQATENINRLLENISRSQLMGCVEEREDCYRLRYEVPGLSKDDVKITVDVGVLTVKGEHKEEQEDSGDDEYWSSRSYGYYNTSIVLPNDAKADDIKTDLKDGVLNIIIPRTEKQKKGVKVH